MKTFFLENTTFKKRKAINLVPVFPASQEDKYRNKNKCGKNFEKFQIVPQAEKVENH